MYAAEAIQIESENNRLALFAAVGFSLVNIGRIQEVIPALAPMQLGKVLFVLASLLLLGNALKGGESVTGSERAVRAFLLFLLMALIATPFSFWVRESLDTLWQSFLVNAAFFFLLLLAARSSSSLDTLVGGFLASAVLLGIPSLFISEEMRQASLDSTYDPNDLALLMVVSLPFVIYGISQKRGIVKILLLLCLPVLLLAFLKAGSRGGMVGLAMVIVVMMMRGGGGLRSAGKVLLVLFIAGFLGYAAPEVFKSRAQTLTHLSEDYNLTDPFGRKQIWGRAVQLMAMHPLTGVGPGCFGVASGEIFADEVGGMAWRVTAHNSFLLVGAELGFPGLILFTGIFFYALKSLREVRRRLQTVPETAAEIARTNALEAALIGFLTCGFFLSQSYHSLPYFLVAMVVAHRREVLRRFPWPEQRESA